MIKIKFYSIIIRKDKANDITKELYRTFRGPKDEDKKLLAFYTMTEDVRDEIINRLTKEAGLKGTDQEKNEWTDFVLASSINGVEEGECKWLKINDLEAEFVK